MENKISEMADNNQNNNNQENNQVANQSNANGSNATNNSSWITVNTSDSVEAQRMNIMKGNDNELFVTKNEK